MLRGRRALTAQATQFIYNVVQRCVVVVLWVLMANDGLEPCDGVLVLCVRTLHVLQMCAEFIQPREHLCLLREVLLHATRAKCCNPCHLPRRNYTDWVAPRGIRYILFPFDENSLLYPEHVDGMHEVQMRNRRYMYVCVLVAQLFERPSLRRVEYLNMMGLDRTGDYFPHFI